MSLNTYRIVVAVDGSDMTEVVLERAFDAARRQDDAEVHVITVVPVKTSFLHRSRDHSGDIEELQAQIAPRVKQALEPFEGGAASQVHLHVRAGNPAEEILEVVGEAEADLVILGRHGWGSARRGIVGSVSERVMRLATSSVLIVQPPDYEPDELVADAPCEACTQIRAESAGERWFCERHRLDDSKRRIRVSSSMTSIPTRGGGVY